MPILKRGHIQNQHTQISEKKTKNIFIYPYDIFSGIKTPNNYPTEGPHAHGHIYNQHKKNSEKFFCLGTLIFSTDGQRAVCEFFFSKHNIAARTGASVYKIYALFLI